MHPAVQAHNTVSWGQRHASIAGQLGSAIHLLQLAISSRSHAVNSVSHSPPVIQASKLSKAQDKISPSPAGPSASSSAAPALRLRPPSTLNASECTLSTR